jgi:hypothetical protein
VVGEERLPERVLLSHILISKGLHPSCVRYTLSALAGVLLTHMATPRRLIRSAAAASPPLSRIDESQIQQGRPVLLKVLRDLKTFFESASPSLGLRAGGDVVTAHTVAALLEERLKRVQGIDPSVCWCTHRPCFCHACVQLPDDSVSTASGRREIPSKSRLLGEALVQVGFIRVPCFTVHELLTGLAGCDWIRSLWTNGCYRSSFVGSAAPPTEDGPGEFTASCPLSHRRQARILANLSTEEGELLHSARESVLAQFSSTVPHPLPPAGMPTHTSPPYSSVLSTPPKVH